MSAYQIADHNLALAYQSAGLGGCLLGSVATRLRLLLDTARRRSGSRSVSDGGAARRATLVGVAPLRGEDLVERLIKLSRHVGD